MKTNLTHLTFIYLTLVGFILPAPAYSSSVVNIEQNSTTTHKHKTPNTNKSTLIVANTLTEKKILIDDSRGLSAFFILGIIINIIMIITFGWWFTKEWRRQK